MQRLVEVIGGEIRYVPRSAIAPGLGAGSGRSGTQQWRVSGARECLRVNENLAKRLLDHRQIAEVHAGFCRVMVKRKRGFHDRALTPAERNVRDGIARALALANRQLQSRRMSP